MTATAGAGAGRRAALAPALVPIQITSLQVGAAAATHLFDRIGTWGTVSLRVILAALVLALLPGRRLGRITRRHLPVVCAYAAVISGMNFAFFAAIDHLPLSVATTIELLGPLTVALAAARSRSDAGWALLAAAWARPAHRPGRPVGGGPGLRGRRRRAPRRLRPAHPCGSATTFPTAPAWWRP